MGAKQVAGLRPGRQGNKELGSLLRRSRKAKGMTMYHLADLIGRNRSMVSLWESGGAPLTNDETISAIAKELEIPKDEIYAASGYVPLDIWLSLCELSAEELGQTREFLSNLRDDLELETHSLAQV